jgi:hypothetical protein
MTNLANPVPYVCADIGLEAEMAVVLGEPLTERTMLDLLHDRYSVDPGNGPRYVCAEHVKSAAGFDGKRTADFMAFDLWPSSGLLLHGFEIKVTRSDWLRELADPDKSEPFRQIVDYWWLVCPPGVAGKSELPPGWGMLVVSDGMESRRDPVWGWQRTRVLRVARQAPRLNEGRPLPRAFLASLLRAAARTAAARAVPVPVEPFLV